MERFEPTTVAGKVYADPELRRIAYEHGRAMKQRLEAKTVAEAERQQSREARLKAFWERLGYTPDRASDEREARRRRVLAMPAAEAWIEEHPEEFNIETAPTVAALGRLVRRERERLKATRRILKELGIK